MGEVPFRDVYITPKMLDGFGETMSKSKGNGVDPLDIIDLYGADALRFSMVVVGRRDAGQPAAGGQRVPALRHARAGEARAHVHADQEDQLPDVQEAVPPRRPWPERRPGIADRQAGVRAIRAGPQLRQQALERVAVPADEHGGLHARRRWTWRTLPVEDRWILSRLATTTQAITEQLEGFRFSDVARTIYDFTWSEFCDWYVEMSKGRLKDPASTARPPSACWSAVLDGIIRLVHPVMPFLAESVWQALGEVVPERGLPTPKKASRERDDRDWPDVTRPSGSTPTWKPEWAGCRNWCVPCAKSATATTWT